MWIFTKHGFFSAVCARQGDGKHGQPVDPDRIMVRARVRGHLEALKKRFPDLLGECEIQESAGTDYAFRLFVAEVCMDAGACRTGGRNRLRQLQVGSRPPSGSCRSGLRAFAARGLVGDAQVAAGRKGIGVKSLAEPLQVGMDNGARRALIPLENKRNFLEVSGDIVERVDPVFFSDPMTAAMKALGMN